MEASVFCSNSGTAQEDSLNSEIYLSYSAGGRIIYPIRIDGARLFEKVFIYITLSGFKEYML